ncbi:MAG: hypothetical protein M9894_37030 [Planctomycetes bacterium]|nr:hypothetical protein [Planctomycetota bacterium]
MEELKRALGSTVFLKDLSKVEPGKKGVAVGEVLRIYEDKGAYTLSFLRGTDERTRKQYRDRLDLARLEYRVGADFAL